MSMSPNLFLAILSMDSYNRGYGAGVAGLSDAENTGLGNAIIKQHQSNQSAVDAGFYAISYDVSAIANLNANTVISYRGTDNLDLTNPANDILTGWMAAAGKNTSQVGLALAFYQTVTGQTVYQGAVANTILTGHSLGGGLAGIASILSGTAGFGFDYMPPEIIAIILAAQNPGTSLNWSAFQGSFTSNEILQSARNGNFQFALSLLPSIAISKLDNLLGLDPAIYTGVTLAQIAGVTSTIDATIVKNPPDGLQSFSGIDSGLSLQARALQLHMMEPLIFLQYASDNNLTDWQTIGNEFWAAYFNEDVGKALGLVQGNDSSSPPPGTSASTGTSDPAGQMRRMIAYTAIDEGVTPFGEMGIRSMFADADFLGKLVAQDYLTGLLAGKDLKSSLSEILVQNAGDQAATAKQNNGHDASWADGSGVFAGSNNLVLKIDLDPTHWMQTFENGSNSQTDIIGLGDLVYSILSNVADNAGNTDPIRAWIQANAPTDFSGNTPVQGLLSANLLDKLDQITLAQISLSGRDLSGFAAVDAANGSPGGALLVGSDGVGTITGSANGNDLIIGGKVIVVGAGDNVILGTAASETFDLGMAGNGKNLIFGGSAANTVDYTNGGDSATVVRNQIHIGSPDGVYFTQAGDDVLTVGASGVVDDVLSGITDLKMRAGPMTFFVGPNAGARNLLVEFGTDGSTESLDLTGAAQTTSIFANPDHSVSLSVSGISLTGLTQVQYGNANNLVDFRTQDLSRLTILLGSGNDLVYLSGKDKAVIGQGGNDKFFAAEGSSFIDGGAGRATISFEALATYPNWTSFLTVNLQAGTAFGFGVNDTFINVQNVVGANNGLNEDLIGSSANNAITCGSGVDVVWGMGGDDVITGRYGVLDTAYYQGTRDQYVVTGYSLPGTQSRLTIHDTVSGRDGTDTDINVGLFRFSDGLTVTAADLLKPKNIHVENATSLENGRLTQAEVVGQVVAQGANVGDGVTYSLSAAFTAYYSIDATTGVLTRLAGSAVSFAGWMSEIGDLLSSVRGLSGDVFPDGQAASQTAAGRLSNSPYEVDVVATDTLTGGSTTQHVFFKVADPPPTSLTWNTIPGFKIADALPGTIVGQFVAQDNDTSGLVFSLTNNDDGRFVVDPVTGIVRVAAGAPLDASDTSLYSLGGEVTDTAGNSLTVNLPVNVIRFEISIDQWWSHDTAWLSGSVSPLVVDLSGTGIKTTGLGGSSTYFDLAGTGHALKTGWVQPGEAFLAIANADGSISSISNLFGSNGSNANGFAALSALDSNGDHVIDANDAAFSQLVLWNDANGDGVVEEGETTTLGQAGVASIALNYAIISPTAPGYLNVGNEIRQTAVVTMVDGTTRTIADVWFANNPTESEWVWHAPLALDLSLPDLSASGSLDSLQQSYAGDPTLEGEMVALINGAASMSMAQFTSGVKSIIYEWTGVANVSSTARGSYVDGRNLGALEALFGMPFLETGASVGPLGDNPGPAGASFDALFGQILQSFVDDIAVQLVQSGQLNTSSVVGSFYSGLAYDQVSTVISVGQNATYDELVANGRFLPALNAFLTSGANNPPSGDLAWRTIASWYSAQPIGFNALASNGTPVNYGSYFGFSFNGKTSGAGELAFAQPGSPLGSGVTISGASDLFIWAKGDGALGVSGYLATGAAATNVLLLEDVARSDIGFEYDPNRPADGLEVLIKDTGDLITLSYQGDGLGAIQSLVFADGSSLALNSAFTPVFSVLNSAGVITSWAGRSFLQGSVGNDTIQAAGSVNTIDGGLGNDMLIGSTTGADTFLYASGAGNDTISEGAKSVATDVLSFTNLASTQVSFTMSGTSLIVTDQTTGQAITVLNEFGAGTSVATMNGNGAGVEQFSFADGVTLSRSDVMHRV